MDSPNTPADDPALEAYAAVEPFSDEDFAPTAPSGELTAARRPDSMRLPLRDDDAFALAGPELHSVSEGFRHVVTVVEEIGRAVEAQAQRSNRLMERVEQLSAVLSSLPAEGERQLEAMDALQRVIEAQRAPQVALHESVRSVRGAIEGAVPAVSAVLAESVSRGQDSARVLWSEATRAVTMELQAATRRSEERMAKAEERISARLIELEARERSRTRRAIVAAAALAFAGAIGAAGGGFRALIDAFAAPQAVVADEQGGANWRPTEVRRASTVAGSTSPAGVGEAGAQEGGTNRPMGPEAGADVKDGEVPEGC